MNHVYPRFDELMAQASSELDVADGRVVRCWIEGASGVRGPEVQVEVAAGAEATFRDLGRGVYDRLMVAGHGVPAVPDPLPVGLGGSGVALDHTIASFTVTLPRPLFGLRVEPLS
ncbi:MAG: hypothetical protein AAF682_19680 [Planctomycetota bacterium]